MLLEELHRVSSSIVGNGALIVPPKSVIESGTLVLRVEWCIKGKRCFYQHVYELGNLPVSLDKFIKQSNSRWLRLSNAQQ